MTEQPAHSPPDHQAPGQPTQPSSLQVYWRLLGYIKPHMGAFAISILGFGMYAAGQPMLAAVLKYFIDGMVDPQKAIITGLPGLHGLEIMQAVPLMLVCVAAWQGVGAYLGNYYLARVSAGLVHDLRLALFDSLLTLPDSYYDRNNSGHLISRITFNVTMVTRAATEGIKVAIREGLIIVALLAYLLWTNWRLTLVLFTVLPFIIVLGANAGRKFRKQAKRIHASMGEVTHVASEAIQGHRIVRSFGGGPYEHKRFVAASLNNMSRQLQLIRTSALSTSFLQLLVFSAMGLLFFLVLWLRGDATPGDLVAYITAAGLIPKPTKQLSEVSSTIQSGVAGAESIFEQIDETPEQDLGTEARDRVAGRIEVRNLSFTYPGSEKRVLSELDFSIEPGQMVALVGRSGSGKTTLANLIPRFYHHPEGQILIDGIDVERFTLRNLRRHVAVVTQHVTLFNDTVANNIAYGDLAGAPRAAIERAAEAAYAREFIDRLPQGLDTLVGENGVLLSGGQRQRLAIARALLKDAPILILDEATSALDTESEQHIQAALERAMQGRTTIVIAHRLSTIEKADRILVMEQGRIVEEGTHAELLARNGHYARLHAMQFRETDMQN